MLGLNTHLLHCVGTTNYSPKVSFSTNPGEVMKALIPGTSEHKLKKEEKKLQEGEKHIRNHEKDVLKHEHNLQQHAAKQEAKDYKNLSKEENKLHKQEARAEQAAHKVAGHQTVPGQMQ